MNRAEENKGTAHEKAIVEILDVAQKLTTNKMLVASVFRSAGIITDNRLSLVSLAGNPETCLNSLMDKLSILPGVVRMSAKRILWNRGLKGGQSVYFLCSVPPQWRASWFTRKTG